MKRVEDELDAGGNVKSLVELGLKVAQQRAAVVRLDVRTVIPRGPDPRAIAAIADLQLKNMQDIPDLQSESGQIPDWRSSSELEPG